jgi:hypothetical protein
MLARRQYGASQISAGTVPIDAVDKPNAMRTQEDPSIEGFFLLFVVINQHHSKLLIFLKL